MLSDDRKSSLKKISPLEDKEKNIYMTQFLEFFVTTGYFVNVGCRSSNWGKSTLCPYNHWGGQSLFPPNSIPTTWFYYQSWKSNNCLEKCPNVVFIFVFFVLEWTFLLRWVWFFYHSYLFYPIYPIYKAYLTSQNLFICTFTIHSTNLLCLKIKGQTQGSCVILLLY